MKVHFIDTSVFVEILKVPNLTGHYDELKKELEQMIKGKDTLILPFATIIETGNHIAQNGSGQQRREAAVRFIDCIKKRLRDRLLGLTMENR